MSDYMFPNVRNGRKVVAAAGTAERLVSTNTPAREVTIMALLGNSDYVVVGGSSVVAAVATRQGIPLSAGSSITLRNVRDLYEIWIDSVVSGEGATFLYQF